MRRRAWLLATVLLCAGCGGSSSPVRHASSTYRGTEVSPPVPAPGFSLRDQAGRTVSMGAQRGHYVIVTFLYTRCPDVCPVIAGNLNRALQSRAARRSGLRVLAVSVDPRHDTAAAVRRYVRERRLLPSFRYLIGTRARLERVWRLYHVSALAGPKGTVTHSTFELLVDPEGRERIVYDSSVRAADVVHDLMRLEAA